MSNSEYVVGVLGMRTVQEAQKSQEKYPGVLLYIFEIHYMRASKRRITLNCNRTRSRDSYLHNLGPNIKVCQIALWLIPYYPRVAYSIPVKLYPCNYSQCWDQGHARLRQNGMKQDSTETSYKDIILQGCYRLPEGSMVSIRVRFDKHICLALNCVGSYFANGCGYNLM